MELCKCLFLLLKNWSRLCALLCLINPLYLISSYNLATDKYSLSTEHAWNWPSLGQLSTNMIPDWVKLIQFSWVGHGVMNCWLYVLLIVNYLCNLHIFSCTLFVELTEHSWQLLSPYLNIEQTESNISFLFENVKITIFILLLEISTMLTSSFAEIALLLIAIMIRRC